MKFASKQMQRSAKKCEKNEEEQKKKLEQAIAKQNVEGARIYAENAIREKNQALSYLRLSSRIDAVSSKIEAAVRMKQITRSMEGVVKGMDAAMQSMDMSKITAVMDKFEKQFEDLDVKTQYIEGAMSQTTTLSTPVDQVDELINKVAEERGLNITEAFGITPSKVGAGPVADDQDELAKRLAALKS